MTHIRFRFEDALIASGLSSNVRLVGFVLARRAAEDGFCFPSYETIIADAGCSRTVAERAIKVLELTGLLRVERLGGTTKKNHYWVQAQDAALEDDETKAAFLARCVKVQDEYMATKKRSISDARQRSSAAEIKAAVDAELAKARSVSDTGVPTGSSSVSDTDLLRIGYGAEGASSVSPQRITVQGLNRPSERPSSSRAPRAASSLARGRQSTGGQQSRKGQIVEGLWRDVSDRLRNPAEFGRLVKSCRELNQRGQYEYMLAAIASQDGNRREQMLNLLMDHGNERGPWAGVRNPGAALYKMVAALYDEMGGGELEILPEPETEHRPDAVAQALSVMTGGLGVKRATSKSEWERQRDASYAPWDGGESR